MSATPYTITMSSDAMTYVVQAVLAQLRADRAQIIRLPAAGFDAFLVEQIAAGTEALTSLNDAMLVLESQG